MALIPLEKNNQFDRNPWKAFFEIYDRALASQHPSLTIHSLGDNEDSIHAFSWLNPKSDKTLVLVGFPHGNEPLGGWYAAQFLDTLLKNCAEIFSICNHSFFIVPILDFQTAKKIKTGLVGLLIMNAT